MASLWTDPLPKSMARGFTRNQSQAISPASLEAPSLGTVRGETHLNSNSERWIHPMAANVPPQPNPVPQKDLLCFPPKRKKQV